MRNEKGQFEKGYSGNPGGKPQGQSIVKKMREYLWEIDPETGINRIEQMVMILWHEAQKGNLKAIELIMDRLEGKPKTSIEMEQKMEPIRIIDFPEGFENGEAQDSKSHDSTSGVWIFI